MHRRPCAIYDSSVATRVGSAAEGEQTVILRAHHHHNHHRHRQHRDVAEGRRSDEHSEQENLFNDLLLARAVIVARARNGEE